MGYFFAGLMLVLVVAVAVVALSHRSRVRGQLASNHPLQVDEPAADEPTPGASDTEDDQTIRRAQRRVPPA